MKIDVPSIAQLATEEWLFGLGGGWGASRVPPGVRTRFTIPRCLAVRTNVKHLSSSFLSSFFCCLSMTWKVVKFLSRIKDTLSWLRTVSLLDELLFLAFLGSVLQGVRRSRRSGRLAFIPRCPNVGGRYYS